MQQSPDDEEPCLIHPAWFQTGMPADSTDAGHLLSGWDPASPGPGSGDRPLSRSDHEPERGLSEDDLVPALKGLFSHRPAVHECPVGAAEVADEKSPSRGHDLEMVA